MLVGQDGSWGGVGEIAIWSGVALALIVGAVVVVALVRRRLIGKDDGGSARDAVFTLAQLRRMHAEGELDDEQFERLKGEMIASVKTGSNPIAEARRARASSRDRPTNGPGGGSDAVENPK